MGLGFWGLRSWLLGLGFWVVDLGSWVLGLGSWVLGLGFYRPDYVCWIRESGGGGIWFSWVVGFGSWVYIFDYISIKALIEG